MEPIIRLSLARRRKNLLNPTYAIEYALSKLAVLVPTSKPSNGQQARSNSRNRKGHPLSILPRQKIWRINKLQNQKGRSRAMLLRSHALEMYPLHLLPVPLTSNKDLYQKR